MPKLVAMKADSPRDHLLEIVNQIRDHCQQHGLAVYYGWAHTQRHETVHWNLERDDDWRHFLQIAKSLSVKVVYLSWAPFEAFQIDEALANNKVTEYHRDVEKFRSKVGLTATVGLAFVIDGVFHIYQKVADWLLEFQELTAGEDQGEEELDPSVVNEWAEKLANDPRYGSCRNKAQRRYLLEELAGQKYERLPEAQILERAERVYFLRVQPERDECLREEARELHKQGHTMTAIAQKLRISRERVRGLLST